MKLAIIGGVELVRCCHLLCIANGLFQGGGTELNKKDKHSLNNLPFAATDPYLITHAHLAADAVLVSSARAIFTPFVSFEEPIGHAGLQ